MNKTLLPILTAALLAGLSSTHAQSLLITKVFDTQTVIWEQTDSSLAGP